MIPVQQEQLHPHSDTVEAPKTSIPQPSKKKKVRDMLLSFEILSPPVSLRQHCGSNKI